MSESANIQENVTDGINQIITNAHLLTQQLKRAELYKRNNGRDFIRDIIVIGHCTMYMSDMTSGSLQELIENTLEYFKTGLYDTNKTSIYAGVDGTSFDVRAWVYTPDTHNDAGEWFRIYTFQKSNDACKCTIMLKQIESELKRLH